MNRRRSDLLQGTAFAANVFGDAKDAKPAYDNIASAVFTTPQIATCGLTEEEAVQEHGDLMIFTSTYRHAHSLGKKETKQELIGLAFCRNRICGACVLGRA